MKKIVVFILLLCITGCKDSSQLTNRCVKKDVSDSLKSEVIYTIHFKNDIIDVIDVSYDYQDTKESTIASLKLSFESQNKFWSNLAYEISKDTKNNYQIIYHIDKDADDEIKEYFKFQEKRSKLVPILKEQGYTCK